MEPRSRAGRHHSQWFEDLLDNGLGPVRYALCPGHPGAVGAAVEVAVRFYAVPYDPAAAVLAGGGERVDCTLEAVESVRIAPGHTYLKSLIVLISTDLTLGHLHSPSSERGDSPFPK